jgi:predicted Zn-dependent peptidase
MLFCIEGVSSSSLSSLIGHLMSDKRYLHKLANGLTVLGEVCDWSKGVAVGIFVSSGARDDRVDQQGISHFLEHMLFKGSIERSALDLSREFGKIGARVNAYTTEEMTLYYALTLSEYSEIALELLADMMRPGFRLEEFEAERNVILEEILSYEDQADYWFLREANQRYFAGHALGNSIVGSEKSVRKLTCSDIRRFFEERYYPGNMAVVAAGKLDWDRFVARAESLCGTLTAVTPQGRSVVPPQTEFGHYEMVKPRLHQGHVLLIAPSCSIHDEIRYELAVLASILGDSVGSRLYWELVDTGIAEYALAENEAFWGAGTFSIYAVTRPANVDRVLEKIQKIVRSPLDFSEADLLRAKNKLSSQAILSGEGPLARMVSLGKKWNYFGRLYGLEELLGIIERVSRSSIERALSDVPLDRWCSFKMLPE